MDSKPYRVGQWLSSDQNVIEVWFRKLKKDVARDYKDKIELLAVLHHVYEANHKAYTPLIELQPDEVIALEDRKLDLDPYEVTALEDRKLDLQPDEVTTLEDRKLDLQPDEVTALEDRKLDLQPDEVIALEDRKLDLHPPVQALMNEILSDPKLNMFFHQMFWQQRDLPNISEGTCIWSWQMMILYINYIMTTAPCYNSTGLVGFPINVILNWPMATTAGFAAFLNDKVNRLFKDILNYWGEYLKSSESTYVLTKEEHGWFSKDAMTAMPNFSDDFICDPNKDHYGFKSWDDFFVRQFREGVRPIAEPLNDAVIANACESAPFQLYKDVKKRDYFWIKSQKYSVNFMLNMDPLASLFHGGTIYQAYLSALSYHRWHSPVSGIIRKAELVDGSYYSQTFNVRDDPASPNMSQGYLTQVAARGIIYIDADNQDIGLMCFLAVGMSEVSSNEITVKEGQHVDKGEELGMFHFGGSTHCLMFRPGVELEFHLGDNIEPGLDAKNIPVRSKLATVKNSR